MSLSPLYSPQRLLAESVCATRSSMPRTCQSDLGPRADNISCVAHSAHA